MPPPVRHAAASRRAIVRAAAPAALAVLACGGPHKASWESVAGRTVFLVLRPQGFGSERRLEAGDPPGLAQAAARLLGAGRLDDAVDYARQSLAAGDNAPAHRVLGAAYARKGGFALSIRHYSDYLGLAPDAPDAAEVRRALETARGDIALPAPREGRAPPAR